MTLGLCVYAYFWPVELCAVPLHTLFFPYAHSFVGGCEPCLWSDSMIFLTLITCEKLGLADKPLLEIELEDSSILWCVGAFLLGKVFIARNPLL